MGGEGRRDRRGLTLVPAPTSWPDEVVAALSSTTFPPEGAYLTCAVSGGADSLALMVLAVAAGCEVCAVHVDHGLRPGGRDESEAVARAAEAVGARFQGVAVTVAPGANLEARARAARFTALPKEVATGHTMDDQAETVLLNLMRGAARDGLAGIRRGPRHPLLALRRTQTRAVCRAVGLDWLEDPSNHDERFLRNRIRHRLLPLLCELSGRDVVPLVARQAEVMADEADLLDALASSALPDPAEARQLAAAEPALGRRAVRLWLRDLDRRRPGADARPSAGGTERGAEQHPPSLAEVDRVLGVARREVVATELGGGLRVARSEGRLRASWPRSSRVSRVNEEEATEIAPSWRGPVVGPTVVDRERLAERVQDLGARITRDYAGAAPLLVGVLKGAMIFMSDLCRAIDLPVDVDFMAVSSYGSATKTSGVVRIVKDLDADVADRHVLVVEDIIDSGLTLSYLRRYLQSRHPASVEVCALLVKREQQRVPLDLRYVGFEIPPAFVVGYGLDVEERFRNLPDVHRYRGPDGGTP